jgi:hypothetical protein
MVETQSMAIAGIYGKPDMRFSARTQGTPLRSYPGHAAAGTRRHLVTGRCFRSSCLRRPNVLRSPSCRRSRNPVKARVQRTQHKVRVPRTAALALTDLLRPPSKPTSRRPPRFAPIRPAHGKLLRTLLDSHALAQSCAFSGTRNTNTRRRLRRAKHSIQCAVHRGSVDVGTCVATRAQERSGRTLRLSANNHPHHQGFQ